MSDLPSDPTTPAIDTHWRSQRNLIHCIAIAVLILTGTFFVFLYRQVVMVRKNTAEMAVFLRQYDESDVSEMILRVQHRLDDYRKKEPTFNPIYVKYFGTNPPPPLSNTLSSKVTPTGTKVPGHTAP